MKALLWIEAARPKTFFISFAPVLLGTCCALKAGSFSLPTFLVTLFTTLAIQIGSHFANDYYDFLKGADTSSRKGPRRLVQAGLIPLADMKLAAFLTLSIAALLSIYLTLRGGPTFALLATVSIFLAVGYTGGPLPLAYLGIGEFFVVLFYGVIATSGTAYLQTRAFSWDAALLGLTPGLAATAVLAVANMRDIEEDRTIGKKTLAARFGHRFAKIEYTTCLLASLFLPLTFGFHLPLIALIPAFIPLRAVWQNTSLIPALAQTGKIGFLASLLTAISFLCGF